MGRADVAVACSACEVDFDGRDDRSEAAYFAGTHNELHHGGRLEAIVTGVQAAARREAAIEAAAAMHGEQGREQAAEDIDQGQADRWVCLPDPTAEDDDSDAGEW